MDVVKYIWLGSFFVGLVMWSLLLVNGFRSLRHYLRSRRYARRAEEEQAAKASREEAWSYVRRAFSWGLGVLAAWSLTIATGVLQWVYSA